MLYRTDVYKYGGRVACYVQENISVLQKDIISTYIELIWLLIHLPYCKPILVVWYRPLSSNVKYLNRICETLDLVTDESKYIVLLGDQNIDWFYKNSPSHTKLISMADVCNLIQAVTHHNGLCYYFNLY